MSKDKSSSVQEFINILESRENWGFKHLGEDLMARAEKCADDIVKDSYSAGLVAVESWCLFLAFLPYGRALTATSDLILVQPNIITKIILLDKHTDDEGILAARQVTIERLNILTRKQLHNEVLTKQRRSAINRVLGQINGNNDR